MERNWKGRGERGRGKEERKGARGEGDGGN